MYITDTVNGRNEKRSGRSLLFIKTACHMDVLHKPFEYMLPAQV